MFVEVICLNKKKIKMIYFSFFRKKIFFFLFLFLLLTCKKNTIEGAYSPKLPEGVDPFEILKIQVDGADCVEIKTGDEANFIRILFADDNSLSQFNAIGLTEKNIQLHPGVQLENINFSTYRLSYQGKYRDYFLSYKVSLFLSAMGFYPLLFWGYWDLFLFLFPKSGEIFLVFSRFFY